MLSSCSITCFHSMLFREGQHRLVNRAMGQRSFMIRNEKPENPSGSPVGRYGHTKAQMGRAKRTRISQRMSQHRVQLTLSLRITASEALISYYFNMFIAQRKTLVNPFSAKTFAAVLAAALSRSPHARPFRLRWFSCSLKRSPAAKAAGDLLKLSTKCRQLDRQNQKHSKMFLVLH